MDERRSPADRPTAFTKEWWPACSEPRPESPSQSTTRQVWREKLEPKQASILRFLSTQAPAQWNTNTKMCFPASDKLRGFKYLPVRVGHGGSVGSRQPADFGLPWLGLGPWLAFAWLGLGQWLGSGLAWASGLAWLGLGQWLFSVGRVVPFGRCFNLLLRRPGRKESNSWRNGRGRACPFPLNSTPRQRQVSAAIQTPAKCAAWLGLGQWLGLAWLGPMAWLVCQFPLRVAANRSVGLGLGP